MAGFRTGQSAKEMVERRDKRAAEREMWTTGLAYINTIRTAMCVNVHMCVHNSMSVTCVSCTEAYGQP